LRIKITDNLKKKGGGNMSDILVVTSKVKKMVKDAGFRTGGDYVVELSNKVEQLVKASIEKVKTEGGKVTLGREDL
jgi:hypothetical protein